MLLRRPRRRPTSRLRVLVALAAVLATGTLVPMSIRDAPPAGADGIPVMGTNLLTTNQIAAWFRSTGRTPKIPVSIEQLAWYYVSEGRAEGVRGDLAFAQSVVETGYFGFAGSIVKPENFNYAGMGACDSCNSGRQFPNARTGVRAQVQHLRNFADPTSRAANLAHTPVLEWYGRRSDGTLDLALAVRNYDTFFAKGRAPTWNELGGPGKWASTPSYGTIILSVYNQMLTFNRMPGFCPPDRLGFGPGEARACPLRLRHPGRAIAAGNGGDYVLNGDGRVTAYGAPYYGSPSFSWDIARDIAVMPDRAGYVVLDGYGGLHLFGSARTSPLASLSGPYFGWDIARALVITPDAAGFYLLDGFGGIHTRGSARLPAGRYPYWSGWDIARSISVTLDGRGIVLVDGFGGVFRAGTVPSLGTTYFGFDIAREIVVLPDGSGYALLDGFGGIHRFGNAPAPTPIGYAKFDRWRGITIRDGQYHVVRNDGYHL